MPEVTLTAYNNYRAAAARRREAEKWMCHIGKHGHGSDVLRISAVHSSIKLTIAGQYTEGGQNYWDSPEVLNKALVGAILKHWDIISTAAVAALQGEENKALVAADAEVKAASDAIALAIAGDASLAPATQVEE